MHTYKKILLVEDDIDDQEFFCEALSRLHPSVQYEIANNGLEALQKVEQSPAFDIIFMDLNMPKVDGFECLRRLKNNAVHKYIPVVIISTSTRKEDMDLCNKLGAAGYFPKPASFDELFRNVNYIVSELITE